MCCFWVWPLLGLAVLVSAEEPPSASCNATSVIAQPPLWVKLVEDEAHFFCSPGFKLRGQSILTCIHVNWNHQVPTCEKLPTTMIKMKCPYDHREWTLENLDNISTWILENAADELILDRKFIEDTLASQRLAAEMMARFNDPFFRFYGGLTTAEKSVPMLRLIRRFQESSEFRQLLKQMREDFAQFDVNDIDEEENVLLQYYGLHFADVLQDIILPYRGLITIQPQSSEEQLQLHTLHAATPSKPRPKVERMPVDMSGEPQSAERGAVVVQGLALLDQYTSSEEASSSEPTRGGYSHAGETPEKKRPTRDRGDIEKYLPLKEAGKDYFSRPLSQVLEGHKAAIQENMIRNNYISYLKSIIRHIVEYHIEKSKWPPSLRPYDIEELKIILGIPDPIPPDPYRCNAPWNLGFELVSNGEAYLESENRVIIRCNPGFVLRGSKELYCDQGRWVPRSAGMPTCLNQRQPVQCRNTVPAVANARIIKAENNFVVFECTRGYTMQGTNMLMCKDDRWVPTVGNSMPVCEPEAANQCGLPRTPANGGATQPHYMADNKRFVVRYYCNRGYSMHGADYSYCVDRQWQPLSFRCELGGVDNVPPDPELPQRPNKCLKVVVPNASVKYYEDGSSTVRVTCLPGYEMRGAAVLHCENNAYLEPTPTCEDRAATPEPRCRPLATAPLNGRVDYITAIAVRYSCNSGFVLQGSNRAVCHNGEWDRPPPVCEPRTGCDSHEMLKNTYLRGYVYSNGRWLECSYADGVDSSGVDTYGNAGGPQFCNGGRWDPEPRCKPVQSVNETSVVYSELIGCTLPENPATNEITITSRGPEIHYRCKHRNATFKGHRVNECVDGRWINPVPYCLRQLSPPLPLPPLPSPPSPPPPPQPQHRCSPIPIRGGAAYVYSEGRIVIYQCKERYFIRGATTLWCERSQWSAPAPKCYGVGQTLAQEDGEIFYEAATCPAPTTYPATTLYIANKGVKAISQCANGFMTTKQCVDGREWVGEEPQCETSSPAGVCEPHDIANGRFFQYRDGRGVVQCNGNFVIESTRTTRRQDVLCNAELGRWDFGLTPPKCVREPGGVVDDRPFDDAEDSKWGSRQQIEDCGPPEVSSDFTFYVQKDGRSIALGCKRPRTKRSAGELLCTEGRWKFTAHELCNADACGLADVSIEHGVKVVYDKNEYVFQCSPNHKLVGAAVAYCPDYQPDGDYNKSLVQEFGRDFKVPQCVQHDSENRPLSQEDVMDSDSAQPCKWLAKFGKFDPEHYYISDGGRTVTWIHDAKETTATCQETGVWLNKAIQLRGKCESVPTEPDHGTFYLYETSNEITIRFQCLDGYRLVGPRVSTCSSSSAVQVPDCVPDIGGRRGSHTKKNNPNPLTSNRCAQPPEALPNARISIHESGEMFVIDCEPGFAIENAGRASFAVVRCHEYRWHPGVLPRCLRVGERTPLPRRPPNTRDYFGRPLPQELSGAKAERQDEMLREQFRDHALQLAEFARARNREMRQSGVPPERIPKLTLPIVSSLTDEQRDKLFRDNEQFYREIEALLASIRDERIRQRRQNSLQPSTTSNNESHIPAVLGHLETPIRELNLRPQDIDLMVMLPENDRVKFLDEKKKQQEKSESDPVLSREFVRKALAKKMKHLKKNSVDAKMLKTEAVADNSLESAPTQFLSLPSSTSEESPSATSTSTSTYTSTSASATTNESLSSSEVHDDPIATIPTTTATATAPASTTTTTTTATATATASARVNGSATMVENISETSAAQNQSGIVVEPQAYSASTRKGYDDSCGYPYADAPGIENGFVLSYDTFDVPDGKALEAKYRCNENYVFEFEYTAKVLCRNGEWVGELPTCILEDDDDVDDDDNHDNDNNSNNDNDNKGDNDDKNGDNDV